VKRLSPFLSTLVWFITKETLSSDKLERSELKKISIPVLI